MNNLTAAGFGCVAALALWQGTKERWIPTLFGMFIIAVTVKWADKTDFPWDQPIIWAGIAVFMAGVYGLKWYDKRYDKRIEPSKLLWCDAGDGHFIGPNEPYRFRNEEGKLYGVHLIQREIVDSFA
jgi:hypothetical protein